MDAPDFKQKSFWQKPEGVTGLLFLSALVLGGGYLFFTFLPQIFYFIGLSFAIIALARPQKSDTKVKRNVEGIDIVVALDISDSMLIEDMKPTNRLESTKKIIKE